MTDDIIEIEVPYDLDRKSIVLALSNSGYPVYIQERKVPDSYGTRFFVCFNREGKRLTSPALTRRETKIKWKVRLRIIRGLPYKRVKA